MKETMTLQQLAAQVQDQSARNRDFLASSSRITVEPVEVPEVDLDTIETSGTEIGRDASARTRHQLELTLEGVDVGPIRPNALMHGQLADKLGIPKRYYDRMLDEAPHLLAENIRHWLVANDKPRLLRTRTTNGHAVGRAYLSNRYFTVDYGPTLEAFVPILASVGLTVYSSSVTDRRLYIQGITPSLEAVVRKHISKGGHEWLTVNESISPGCCISNSEVGCGNISVSAIVYTQACSNTALMHSVVKRAHLGSAIQFESNQEYLTPETRKLQTDAMLAAAADTLKGMLSPAEWDKHVAKVQRAADNTFTEETKVPAAVEEVTKRFSLTQTEGASVLDRLIKGGDLSQWGVSSAITQVAQDLSDYDRGVELERIGGQVIEMGRSAFQPIAMAN